MVHNLQSVQRFSDAVCSQQRNNAPICR